MGLHSQKNKVPQHVADLAEQFCEKEESINRARKQFDEEGARRQKEIETKFGKLTKSYPCQNKVLKIKYANSMVP